MEWKIKYFVCNVLWKRFLYQSLMNCSSFQVIPSGYLKWSLLEKHGITVFSCHAKKVKTHKRSEHHRVYCLRLLSNMGAFNLIIKLYTKMKDFSRKCTFIIHIFFIYRYNGTTSKCMSESVFKYLIFTWWRTTALLLTLFKQNNHGIKWVQKRVLQALW